MSYYWVGLMQHAPETHEGYFYVNLRLRVGRAPLGAVPTGRLAMASKTGLVGVENIDYV